MLNFVRFAAFPIKLNYVVCPIKHSAQTSLPRRSVLLNDGASTSSSSAMSRCGKGSSKPMISSYPITMTRRNHFVSSVTSRLG